MEAHHERVHIAVGKNVEEGVGILRWALNQWSSQPVSFVILHINTSSKDFVLTPFGRLPASSVNDEILDAFRAKENERVDKLLNKYMSLCCKVKAEVLKVDGSEEAVHKILVGLISSHGIKKLVMGFKVTKSLSWKGKSDTSASCYVQKHKPNFCQLFIVSGGKLVMLKEENVDDGGYVVDECGLIIVDFRKKSKDKGSFKGWLGRKLTDNISSSPDNRRSSPHLEVSLSSVDIAHEIVNEKWEDNAEEVERYVQCLLTSSSPELEHRDDEININQSFVTRTEVLRAIKQAKKFVEQKNNEAKADQEKRRKSERIISLCNQRADQIEANLREEVTAQVNLKRELDAVKGQLHEVSSNITESKSKLTSELDQQGELANKIQAFSLEKALVEAEVAKVEIEKAELSQQMEEIRRQRDSVKRRADYYKEREATAETNGLNYGYREFSEEEVRDATDNFSEKMVIAAGSEGTIYRGSVNHITVAIKFNIAFMESLDEFKAQVELLRNISHPHILTMIGACSEHRCIVFEYTQNGSLHDILFPSSSKNHTLPIPWRARIRIVGNVCSALGFLHSSQPRPTAHGRLNSSHVLLDSNLTAKITGLHSCSVASAVSDITALGLLILQLLTGNKEVCMQEVRLATEEDTLAEMLDQNAGDWPLDIAKEFARIGLRCSEEANRDEQGVPMLIGEMMKEVEDLRAKAEGHGGDKPNPLDIPDTFLCPIFQEVMKEPYVAADGFSYELEAIKEWLSTGHETSPMTNLKLKNKLLTPNHNLQCFIRDWHEKPQAKIRKELFF